MVLREVLSDNFKDLLVAEVAGGGEEALSGGRGHLDGLDVRESQVPNIDPYVSSSVRYFFLAFALDEVACPLVRGIQAIERVEVMDDGPDDEGRIDAG